MVPSAIDKSDDTQAAGDIPSKRRPCQPGCVGMFCGQCIPLSADGVVSAPRPPPFGTKVPDRCGGLQKLSKGGRGERRHPGGEGIPPAEKIPENKAASHRVTLSVSAPNFKHPLSTLFSMGVVHADGFGTRQLYAKRYLELGVGGSIRAPQLPTTQKKGGWQ